MHRWYSSRIEQCSLFFFASLFLFYAKCDYYVTLTCVENDSLKLSLSVFQSLTCFLAAVLIRESWDLISNRTNLQLARYCRTSVFSWHDSAVLHINCGLRFSETLNEDIGLSHFSMLSLHSARAIAEKLGREDESELLLNSPSFLLLKQISRDLRHMNPVLGSFNSP